MKLDRRTGAGMGVVILGIILTAAGLWLGRPTLSRQEAIAAAVNPKYYPRVEAKLVTYSTVSRVISPGYERTDVKPNDRVWAVAIQGRYGVVSTIYPKEITYGVAIVSDERPPTILLMTGGTEGDWPPYWDELTDLSWDK